MNFMKNLFRIMWGKKQSGDGGFGFHTARIHSADCSYPEGTCNGSHCLTVGAWGCK